ncbi:MAG: DUF4157 domain-containing protein, partial [Bacteroidia bacterium]
GDSLKSDIAEEMGSKMGADFSGVKVHSDGRAADMNDQIQAKAFTHGNDIYFNQGEYNPSSNEGKHLLAHELTHTVQQSTNVQPMVQRTIKEDLDKDKTKKKLDKYDVKYLLQTEFGKNILSDLSLSQPSESNKIDVLAAGSVAFSLGMLKQRRDYYQTIEDNPPVMDYSGMQDADRKVAKKKVIDLIAINPDKNTAQKMREINSELVRGGNDSELTVNILEPTFQAGVIASLQTTSEPFFREMLSLKWIDTKGVPDSDVMMPDQLLAAVGDSGPSAGLAGSPEVGSVGVGYFMYGSVKNITGRTTAPDLYGEKILTIGFPTNGALQMRISAYGFDPLAGYNIPLNMNPTRVEIKSPTASIGYVDFHAKQNLVKTVENVSLPKDILNTVTGGAITMTIPITYKPEKGGLTFTTKVIPGYDSGVQKYRDKDEVQVQFSTNGLIVENIIIEKKFTTDTDQNNTYTVGSEFVLEVLFDTDKDTIKAESIPVLDKFVKFLQDNPTIAGEVQGHTDSEGSDTHNMDLSQRRANAVMKYAVDKGITPARLTARGYGETSLVRDKDLIEDKDKSRRVIFKILKK